MKKIPLISLALLIVAAIDSIRNLPAPALFGSSLIFFFTLSAVLFLIPVSLVSAELSATFPEKGGVYHWVREAFGPKWAMLAIWLQWINTMVWYPTILSFIAGTAAYLIDPQLVTQKSYVLVAILVVFWGVTFVNFKGIHFSARLNSLCAVFGVMLPMTFLVLLGVVWVVMKRPVNIDLSWNQVIPSLSQAENWVSLVAIMASFLGMELAGVHVNDIREPQKNFPKAVFYAAGFILASMLFGSLTIAIVLPASEINLLAGVIQVLESLLSSFGLKMLVPVFVVLIVLGTLGQITNYLISPAKGLLHAAEFGFMPKAFMRKNKHGVCVPILLGQGIMVSIVCIIFLFVPTVNAFYWFLTALSTELYMLMYLLMFAAALRLHHRLINRPKTFKIPYGNVGMWTTGLLGMLGCIVTVIVSFFPPDALAIGSSSRYALMIGIGNVVSISPVLLFFWYKKKF